ncbi:MAG: sigma-70 family RNA polymerase sigma factor [Myxococcota bacterium]
MDSSDSDATLCAASGLGNEQAFVELVRRYQGAVCAVTFAATGRRDLSEDLAQETFIVAWKKLRTLKAPDKVGAWLTGVARNLSRKSARDKVDAPLPDAGSLRSPDADPEDAMVDQQRDAQLWSLLAALPDRNREAMVLYYREDQSAPRVAELLGISVAAAEQRLSRGRRLLRGKVDRAIARELSEGRPGDAFTRRVAAALPLALPTPGSASAQTAAGVVGAVGKAIVMKKIAVAILAVLAVVLTGYAVTNRQPPQTAAAEQAKGPSSGASRGMPDRVRRDPDVPDSVAGQVVTAEDGRAIAGSVVTIVDGQGRVAHTRVAGRAGGLAVTRTDEAGRFVVAGLPRGRYRATATAAGRLPAHHAAFVVRDDTPGEDLRIALASGGHTLRGTVSDIGGGPVDGAVVVARGSGGPGMSTVTDAEGAYALTLADGRYGITANDVDYQPAEAGVTMRAAEQVLDLRLVPGAAIFGTVVDRATGQPVGGASVTFDRVVRRGARSSSRRSRDEERAVTDARGEFALRRLGAAEYQLMATADHRLSFAPTEVSVAIAEQRQGVVVFVDPGVNLRGRVVDKANPDVAVADVEVEAAGMGNFPPVAAKSDADGRFTLMGMGPGTYSLLIGGEGVIASMMETTLDVKDADIDDYVLPVARGTTIAGTLTPRGAAEVRLGLPDSVTGLDILTKRQKIKGARVRSNDDGVFELTGVPEGAWVVVAEASDGSLGELDVDVPADGLRGLAVKLSPRATVRGIVRDVGGTGVAGATVRLAVDRGRPGPPTAGQTATTDTEGAFALPGVADGAYRLTVTDRSHTPLRAPGAGVAAPGLAVAVSGHADVDVDVDISVPDGIIAGVVRGPGGTPHPDAWVTIRPTEGDPFHESRPPVVSDAMGEFEFTGLADGGYVVDVSSRDSNASGSASANVGDDVVVDLEQLGQLVGRVTADGQPVRRFEIKSRRTADASFVDDDGRFALSRIAAGKSVVTITATQGSATRTVDIGSGGATSIDVELQPWGTIAGRAVTVDGEPAAGLVVSAEALGGERDFAKRLAAELAGTANATSADGRFTIEGLGAGRVAVTFDSGGAVSGTRVRGGAWAYLEPGEVSDLGDVVVLGPDELDAAERGDLGLRLTAGFEPPPPPAPPGSPEPRDAIHPIGKPSGPAQLWIASISPGGPAAATSLKPGLRVLSLGGHAVEDLGAKTAAALVSPRIVKAGARYPVVVETESGTQTVVVVAAPAATRKRRR